MNAHAATLRTAFFPRSSTLTNVLLVVGGAALVALCAQVSIKLPFTPVPVTGQTFGVLLVGAGLGPISGAASLGLYLVAGLVGAPVYADGAHGWDVIVSASGGYLIGFILAASLTGWLASRAWDRHFRSASSAMLAGNVVIYMVGLPWLAWQLHTNLETTLEYGLYPFVIGDLLKLYLAAVVLPGAWRLAKSRES
jgi:biotin transport system substrate-specific component